MKTITFLALLATCTLASAAATGNKFTYHVHDGAFTIDSVNFQTQHNIPFAAGAKATLAFSGTVANASAILAGDVQFKIYENFVQHFTDSGNEAYFECTNKGCNRYHGVGLDLADPTATTPSQFTASLTFIMPVAKKTGQFRMVVWGSDQRHFPYDFSMTVGFNYSSSDASVSAVAASPSSTYQPAKITWSASSPGNMTVSSVQVDTIDGVFAPSDAAHVQITGNLTAAVTDGAVQYQVYEQGVRSFVAEGNADFFKCTNKGCNIMEPVALKLDSRSVPTGYTLKFAFAIPTPTASGQFTVVAWTTNQDHAYQFSSSIHFNVAM